MGAEMGTRYRRTQRLGWTSIRQCRIGHHAFGASVFQRQAHAAGLGDDEVLDIASTIAANPGGGDLMKGTGGARKMRHPGRGYGKSGGYRTIQYFGGEDVPVFLLALIDKGARANLTASERNELARTLPRITEAYRARQTTS